MAGLRVDGQLFLLHGVPEGSGGSFTLFPGEDELVLTEPEGRARVAYEFDGDLLTLHVQEVCAPSGETCTTDRTEMDPVSLHLFEQTFTRNGGDPSY